MARKEGSLKLSSNIEPRAAAPLDARTVVPTLADLTASGAFPYPYVGMIVSVQSEGKAYMLTALDTTDSGNWNEVGTGGSQTLTGLDDVDINLIEWDTKTWTGLTNFEGDYIWSDGDNIYYSYSSNQYVLNKSTLTWSIKTWNGLTNIYGNHIWTDGENIYYSYGSSNQYVLDKSTSTWSPKEWTGLTNYIGDYIWTDGENIYYSGVSDQYILDKSTSTWLPKTWTGLTNFDSFYIWTDGNNIYYSRDTQHYKLNHTDEALIYDWANQKWINKEIVSKEDITKTFSGTHDEWELLSTAEKKAYDYVAFTDDSGGVVEIPDTYSTSEVKTNKIWIDDKSIYRIIGYFENDKNQSYQGVISFNTVLQNEIDTITSVNGIFKNANNKVFSINTPVNVGSNSFTNAYVVSNSSSTDPLSVHVTIQVSNSSSEGENVGSGYIIVEYTKTTD